jgi:DNA-3-methyladenine glycosylase
MFGPAGFLYVYFIYGMHWCMNVVCGPEGEATAVLLRAGEIVVGEDIVRERRPGVRRWADLARGPARLTSCLGITGASNGADLLDPCSPVRLELPRTPIAEQLSGPRVGVSAAADEPWRFWLAGHPTVSAYRRARRAPAPAAPQIGPARATPPGSG